MRRVEVEWQDSTAVAMGWDTLDAYREHAYPDMIVSLGFVVEDARGRDAGAVLEAGQRASRERGRERLPRDTAKRHPLYPGTEATVKLLLALLLLGWLWRRAKENPTGGTAGCVRQVYTDDIAWNDAWREDVSRLPWGRV